MAHLHEKELMHGDLKLLNVVRFRRDNRLRLIDFDAALMMEPATLSGTIIGVTCNKVCPPWLITLLLIVFLGITTQRTFRKAFKKWAQESIRQISDGPSSHYQGLGLIPHLAPRLE